MGVEVFAAEDNVDIDVFVEVDVSVVFVADKVTDFVVMC